MYRSIFTSINSESNFFQRFDPSAYSNTLRTVKLIPIYLDPLFSSENSHPSKWRHLHFEASSGKRATSWGIPSNLLRWSVPGCRKRGYTDIQRERQAGKKREREQGREKMLHGGGKKGWLVLSGRGICAPVSACIWETAMHLCMFRDYRMFLANNGLAVRSTGRKPEVLGRHFRRGLLAWSQVAFSRARIFSFVADE